MVLVLRLLVLGGGDISRTTVNSLPVAGSTARIARWFFMMSDGFGTAVESELVSSDV